MFVRSPPFTPAYAEAKRDRTEPAPHPKLRRCPKKRTKKNDIIVYFISVEQKSRRMSDRNVNW